MGYCVLLYHGRLKRLPLFQTACLRQGVEARALLDGKGEVGVSKLRDFIYSLGSFSASILGQTVTTFAIYYYVDVLKVPTKMISLVMLFYGIWNAINDPLFGQISDTTRTKWWRRIPYVAGFTLPLCIAFALLWMPPYPAGAEKSLFIWYFIVIFLFDGLFTIVVLNWTALFPEMSTRRQGTGFRLKAGTRYHRADFRGRPASGSG